MTATAFSLPDTAPGPSTPARPPLRAIDPAIGRANAARIDGAGGHAGRLGFDPLVEAGRRRRFVAALVLSVVVIVAAYVAGFSLTSFGPVQAEPSADAPYVHVVRPGDSYGAIATILGSENPNAGAEILRANNGGADLVVGQRMVVPAGTLTE